MLDQADRQVLATLCSICQFLAQGTPFDRIREQIQGNLQ
jgi:hypothetical protein